ncbi:TNF receptor-associated factor 6-like isoform X2 [Saccostrea echinata]|nr:TNF receptor-associated factor 6-like isoform X2 [Saccostrea echinata]
MTSDRPMSSGLYDYTNEPRHSSPVSSGSFTSGEGLSGREEGYDYEFIIRDEKYDCPICLLVLREPQQTTCGHRFCKNCIHKWLKESDQRCPIDNMPITESQLFPDNFAKREILGLSVKCPNSKEGCQVIETLKNVQKHLDECEYVPIPCPNKCSHILLRKDIQEHLSHICHKRTILCKQCKSEVLAEVIQEHMDELCPLAMVKCPYCATELMREQLQRHFDHDCMRKSIDCVYSKLGCNIGKIPRSEMGKHLQENLHQHMQLMCQALTLIYRRLNIQSLNQATQSQSLPDRTENISSIDRRMLEDIGNGLSGAVNLLQLSDNPAFATPQAGPHSLDSFRAPDVNNRNLRALSQGSEERFGSERTQIDTELTYTSNPSNNLEGFPRVPFDDEFQSLKCQNISQDESLARHELLLLDMKHTAEAYEKNNAVLVKKVRSLENAINEFEGRNCNGIYFWRIKNYSKFRSEAELGEVTAIHSPAFYSNCFGYKICIRANLNGVDSARGTHLSIFVHFMQGEFDDILEWPFSGRIMLSVLDQNPTCELRSHVVETLVAKPTLAAFQRPTTPRNHKGFGYMEFLPLSVLDNSTYIRNDTLIIKAHIVPT